MNRILRLYGLAALATVLSACAHAAGIAKGPYLQNPTTTSMVVCWVSDNATTGSVQCAPARSGAGAARRVTEVAPTRFHKVRLNDLKPYTRYNYVVDCANQRGAGSFITAAPPNQPFRFVAYGDTRSQADKHAAVIANIIKFKPDFVIQSGDLVANGANEQMWDEFFRVAEPLLRTTPYMPELGNHEGESAPYFRYFDVPRDYSFDYGNIHFTALDSNRPASEQAAQDEWLRKDLAAHQHATWRIVYMHHTPFTCTTISGRREAAAALRARLEPILVAGHVQMVVSGHDHNYQRHASRGITYIVSGGGGAPLYPVVLDTPNVKVAKSVYHHCEITVNGPKMAFRAVDINGSTVDQFNLTAMETK